MGLATDRLAFVSAAAAEMDRLIVRGHERADEFPEKPPAVANMAAFPHLLNFAAIVLRDQPITRADIGRIVPYTPSALIEGLIDNNISECVVTERDGAIELTDAGREAAEGVVAVQDAVFAELWSSAPEQADVVERLLGPVVENGQRIEPPMTPSNFSLFAPRCERPTKEGRVLRLITAVRYWRADAHLRAVADADLRPFEAHALNVLWDTHRAVERVGQGYPEPGRKGIASLEVRGLADAGGITAQGINLREQIERDTDVRTAPIYDPLDEPSRGRLLAALTALPA